MAVLEIEVEGHVATITLNRPEAMNSIDPELRAALQDAWTEIDANDGIRVAILTGAGGRAFCAGADLKRTMPPKESHAQRTFGSSTRDHLLDGLDTDKPLIAAVNGFAVGGGMELALACDIRIASTQAQFGLAEVRQGSIPGAGGTQTLPRAIGRSAAMQMLLTGDRVDAQEALRIGLVSEVVAPDSLMVRAREVAIRIAQNAPLSVRAIKRLVVRGADVPLQTGIDMERFVWGLLRDTEDRIEGRIAFQEKRSPVYRGR